MITTTATPPTQMGEAEYERFRELVRERSGLELTQTRRPDLERAVLQSLIETASPSMGSLYSLLLGDDGHQTLETLIARLTVGETYFFRNRPQFHALEQVILPELIAKRRESRTLRIW